MRYRHNIVRIIGDEKELTFFIPIAVQPPDNKRTLVHNTKCRAHGKSTNATNDMMQQIISKVSRDRRLLHRLKRASFLDLETKGMEILASM